MASPNTLKHRTKALPVNYICCSMCRKPLGQKWQQPATMHKIKEGYYCEDCLNKGTLK